MEKNINGTSSKDSGGVCEKLFSAITASPAFQTIRRFSSPARDHSPLANANHAGGKKISDIQSKPQQPNKLANQVVQVPIKFEKTEVEQPASSPYENRGKLSTSHKSAAKIEPAEPAQVAKKKVIAIEHITHSQEGKKEKKESKSESLLVKGGGVGEGQHINAAMKVEKAQQIQVKNEPAGGVDINERFSQYINQAKIKIRTMSSKKIQESDHEGTGGGKDVHFSDFIDRAKNKFKSSTSNVGGTRKTVSYKRY